ncbi:MAG: hypothetical protein ACFFDD_12270 [Promethearchaeota archaeon]
MRVLVVGSCGKKKSYDSPKQPTCKDIDEEHDLNYWKQQFSSHCVQARDMYTGPQSRELVKAVDLLRTIPDISVQLVIISAGFGILNEEDLVPPYDCSFTTMRMPELRRQAEKLQIQDSIKNLLKNRFDLIYLALGKRYLLALGRDVVSTLETPTIVFHNQSTDYLIQIPCEAETVKSFSKREYKIHGVVGFKGDLLRILAQYALGRPNPRNEVRKWTDTAYLRELIYSLGGLGKLTQ